MAPADRPSKFVRHPGAARVVSIAAVTTALADLRLLASGKVREMYAVEDDLLMVASDRISTYDVVHPNEIPDKGKVLTGLSVLWFDLTRDIVPNHLAAGILNPGKLGS